MTAALPPLYFATAVGCLLAAPAGYALLRLHAGPHAVQEVLSFLAHTRHLLRTHGWQQLLRAPRGMSPFTSAEQAWLLTYWLAPQHREGRSLSGAEPRRPGQGATLTYHGFPAEDASATWQCQLG